MTDLARAGKPANYYLSYAWRNPSSFGFSPLGNAAWSGFTRVALAAPTSRGWSEALTELTVPSGMHAVTYGLEIEHDDADGRVDVDVDHFSHCRINADDSDSVPSCELPNVG